MGTKFKVGDSARVCVDWIAPGTKTKTMIVKIVGFQQNGNTTFAKVKWTGNDAIELAEQYGNLFTFQELRKA
jgi:hypothetical protein